MFIPFGFMGGLGVDPDVEAFLAATGITDATTVEAINTLVSDLKGAGTANGGTYWDNLIAFYPFAGGTASAHSYNLKDTTQYQITWNGTVTHNANGITGDGSTGYGDTGWSPTNDLAMWSGADSGAIGFYSRTNTTANSTMMGAGPSGTNGQSRLMMFHFLGSGYVDWADKAAGNNAGRLVDNDVSTQGHVIASSQNNTGTNQTTTRLYKDGVFQQAKTETLTTIKNVEPDTNMYILARSGPSGGTSGYSSDNLASAFISYFITNGAETTAFDTIVNDYQTTMGRNVY